MITLFYVATGSAGRQKSFGVRMRAGGIISPWGDCADVYVPSGPTVNDGLWHSVAITYTGSGGIISLYIDNVIVIRLHPLLSHVVMLLHPFSLKLMVREICLVLRVIKILLSTMTFETSNSMIIRYYLQLLWRI